MGRKLAPVAIGVFITPNAIEFTDVDLNAPSVELLAGRLEGKGDAVATCALRCLKTQEASSARILMVMAGSYGQGIWVMSQPAATAWLTHDSELCGAPPMI